MPQYFDNVEGMEHQDLTFRFDMFGRHYLFHSDKGVFSKTELDYGTKFLLETIGQMDLGTHILDLGCGVGPIGLVLACLDETRRVTLADISYRAVECAKRNAMELGVGERVEIIQSDIYDNIDASFSSIVTNPPIRAGKKVTYAMYAGALSHLNEGGSLILVIRKAQGAPSCQSYLETLFKEVRVAAQSKGFRILIAKK